MFDVLFEYKERKEIIDISQSVGVCCRKGSIMLKIKEGESLDVCIDGLAYLLIAKSEAILSHYSKDKKTKKFQKKTFFPPLPKIKKGRGQTNANIKFAKTFREEYKKEFTTRVQDLIQIKAMEKVNRLQLDLQEDELKVNKRKLSDQKRKLDAIYQETEQRKQTKKRDKYRLVYNNGFRVHHHYTQHHDGLYHDGQCHNHGFNHNHGYGSRNACNNYNIR